MSDILIVFFFAFCSPVFAKSVQRTIFSADVVASGCHVVVDGDGAGVGQLTFGTFRKSSDISIKPQEFIIRLYESGATVQGCSAFQAGRIATLEFGNPGQLDAAGVITRGAGDGIRVDVRAVDIQADYRERLTQARHTINYPVNFATKGQFHFRAQPVIPVDVKAGEYIGALSFIVTYQ
ncbi:fimbrial protein [Escherichia coli]|uniref:fimbrial protein n=1 Tax=Escherichia coli TaxID=562 RepID=UPI000541997B|nr:fimbrial protein [Escherichia coli]EEU9452257.1 fimbrial protein [Escherichia coli]EFO0452392.1 fimbrial protein [Escherichia coli]EFO2305753.1 fimbrial protein [Escherichia coli]EFT2923649.1 fimbrial protein [Escherichia coli]EIU0511589.1 fimbrial protein [Escherichia coli]